MQTGSMFIDPGPGRRLSSGLLFAAGVTLAAAVLLCTVPGCAAPGTLRTTAPSSRVYERKIVIERPATIDNNQSSAANEQDEPKVFNPGPTSMLGHPAAAVAACLLAADPQPLIDLRQIQPGQRVTIEERHAVGTGTAVDARGEAVNTRIDNSAPDASISGIASASGGGVGLAMRATGASEGQVILWWLGSLGVLAGGAIAYWRLRAGLFVAATAACILAAGFYPWLLALAAAATVAGAAWLVLDMRKDRLTEEAVKPVLRAVDKSTVGEGIKAEVEKAVGKSDNPTRRTLDRLVKEAGA